MKNRTNNGEFFIFHTPELEDVYIDLSSRPQWKEIEKLLNDKRYSVKDTDASYRSINHWTEVGLLDDSRTEGRGWRKLSFKDVVWLRILRDLRNFGLSLDKLQVVFKSLSPSTSIAFESGLALCFQKKPVPVFVVVFEDGTAEIATIQSLHATEYLVGYQLPYIRLSLNTLCCEVLGTENCLPSKNASLELLESELEVIKVLREQDSDHIHLRLQDKKIKDIEQSKRVVGAERISELMEDISFGEISIKMENGKPVSAWKTKKQRIKT